MFTKRRTIRFIAVFLLLNFIFDLVLPNISWALMSGPSTPETSTFEPIDTSDMVNLSSGDFVYNMPLLEVPGPSGGYPVSLSYHAGIMPNQEASWVGLGWNINPGAIARTVSGLPDDHFDINSATRSYWSGGETNTYGFGVSIGIYGLPQVSAGVQIANDTYEGVGVGFSVGATLLKFDLGPANGGVGVSAGVGPYGGAYASAGVGLGISMGSMLSANLGAGLSVASNHGVSGYAGGGVGFTAARNEDNNSISSSLVGGSLSSDGGKIKGAASVGGGRLNNSNSKTGNISTSNTGFSLQVPVWYGVSVSFSKHRMRYWMDETDNISTNGALYFPENGELDLDKTQYDTYSISRTLDDHSEPKDASLGNFGTLPDYDIYNVMGQGVSGNIRPFHLEKELVRRNKFSVVEDERNSTTIQRELYDDNVARFRFVNDFSNKWTTDAEREGAKMENESITHSFDTDPESFYYLESKNVLPGSRDVRHFTVGQMRTEATPIISNSVMGDHFSDDILTNQVGGFLITNESGVQYHYALPAYEKEEYIYSGNKEDVHKERKDRKFNETHSPDPYAYVWHLTAITGPDYIDREPAGLGEEDWGYWVEFNYGKWTENYHWRNPAVGFHSDLFEKFHNYSSGKKELYYLDYIRTKTYTALFPKSIRDDNKSLAALKNTMQKEDAGFYPVKDAATGKYAYPVSSLKLDAIVLIENNAFADLMQTEGYQSINELKASNADFTNGSINNTVVFHEHSKVLETKDLNVLENLKDYVHRKVVLHSTYDLAENTLNSFSNPDLYSPTPPLNANNYEQSGKLTLTAVSTLGKKESSVLPPVNFNYELSNPKSGKLIAEHDSGREIKFDDEGYGFAIGELLKLEGGKGKFNAVIIDYEDEIYTALLTGGDREITDYSGYYAWQVTKNPVHDKDAYTNWNQFKADYYHTENNKLENIRRYTTEIASKSADAWSLRQIHTSLGGVINIDYECDTYSQEAYPNNISFPIKSHKIIDIDENIVKVVFDTDVIDFPKLLSSQYYDEDFELWIPYFEHFSPGAECGEQDLEAKGYQLMGDGCGVFRVNEVFANITFGESSVTLDLDDEITLFRDSETFDFGVDCQDMQLSHEYFGGNFVLTGTSRKYGGGLRTAALRVQDELLGTENVTHYSYSKPNSSLTSGTVSYQPGSINEPNVNKTFSYDIYPAGSVYCFEQYIDAFRNLNIWDAHEFARFVPPPSVLYEYVTMTGSNIHKDGSIESQDVSSRYHFQIFEPGMVSMTSNEIFPDPYTDPKEVFLTDEYTPPENQDNKFPESILVKEKNAANHTIKTYTQQVGGLLSIVLLDGNGSAIAETKYNSLVDENDHSYGDNYESLVSDQFGDQGVIQETYYEQRYVRDGEHFKDYGVFSKVETYPHISLGETNINHKTGIKTSTKNLEFDHFSGVATKSMTTDSYGNEFLTEVVPAYKSYGGMGLAVDGGKNMLTQQGATYTYKIDSDDATNATKKGLVSASAQTWSLNMNLIGLKNPELRFEGVEQVGSITVGLFEDVNDALSVETVFWFEHKDHLFKGKVLSDQGGGSYSVQLNAIPDLNVGDIIKGSLRNTYTKKASYSWKGDDRPLLPGGLYRLTDNDETTFHEFNGWYNEEKLDEQWQKNSEVTLIDVFSHALEARDINGQYAATKMDGKQEKVFSTVANARYNEFAYAGAEDDVIGVGENEKLFWGDVYLVDGKISSSQKHTGNHSISVGSKESTLQFEISNPSEDHSYYRASVWTNSLNGQLVYSLDDGTPVIANVDSRMKSHNWYLINVDIPVTNTSKLIVYCQSHDGIVHFDDFRVHPLDAAMTSYVYNEWDELSHILDAGNFYTKYGYNKMGQLEKVWIEVLDSEVTNKPEKYDGSILTSRNKIHYAKSIK